jgi:CubicO group peptidase (beta-lactamase class C family)
MIIAAIAAASLAAQIDRLASEALSSGPKAGMSVAVVRRGQTILAKGYGFANVELAVPSTPETVYHADSITKHLTAGAVLRLVDEKKLSLDDPITKFVAPLPPSWADVRIRHLLNHTSGSASYTSLPSWGPQERLDLSHEDVLALIRNEPFHSGPGTAWRYNNSGFYLLGMVIEKVTGKSYADAMREMVFVPLGMTSTQYCGFRPIIRNRAAGYVVDRGKLVNAEPMSWAAPFAGGAVCSTAGDLVRYERALEEHQLFGEATLQAMRAPTVLPDGAAIDYGFGTRLGNLGGHRIAGHTGNGGGFRNVLERFPDDDLTVVVLSNTDGGGTSPLALATRIARLVLGVPDEPVRDLPVPAAEIGAYAGTFESDEGTVTNVISGERIAFRPGEGAPVIPLPYQGESLFAVEPDMRVKFIVRDGKAIWASVYGGGLFLDASRRVP